MSYNRRIRLAISFWLLRLEQKKFDAYVRAFRVLRNTVIKHSGVEDKPAELARLDAEDALATEATTNSMEENLFAEVGRALSV